MTPLERQAVAIGRQSAEKNNKLHDLSAWIKTRGKRSIYYMGPSMGLGGFTILFAFIAQFGRAVAF